MTPREISIVPREVGTVILHERPPTRRSGPRSYTHDGRCLECLPGRGYTLAVDAEALSVPAGRYLAEHTGLSPRSCLALWTRIEVVAKLTAVRPVVLLQHVRAGRRLPAAGISVRTVVERDLVVSAGWAPAPPSAKVLS